MNKVLVLGAGLVSKPLVRYLLRNGINVSVASRTVSKAEKIIENHPLGEAIPFDIEKEEDKLYKLIPDADLVVSLLPYIYHVKVAHHCIKYKKHMVTTSYVSEEMKRLDEDVKSAKIIFLNEIGLDPGIDHMSAMRVINNVRKKGGKIESFHSYCGALPAPEAADNPFKYKFSWSPRGVVLAAKNAAKYLKDKKIVDIPGDKLFDNYWTTTIEGIDFEVYPNRDSLKYISLYGIEEVETMIRGTLRYPGWCSLWKKISEIGLLSENKIKTKNISYAQFMAKLANITYKNIKKEIASKFAISDTDMEKLDWLGLFSDNKIEFEESTPLDILCSLLLQKLQYKENERDMVVLQDSFIAKYNGKKEKIVSYLIDYGEVGVETSVSRTVSLPAAIGVKLILDGKITITGVCIPTIPEIYEPVIDSLKNEGIILKEEIYE